MSRVRDPILLSGLHRIWRECCLCGEHGRLSLHHVHKHPRDDVQGNLVMVCGDGTTGCHGKIEAADYETRRALVRHLRDHRPDVIQYLAEKLRTYERADAWLDRHQTPLEER